MEVGSESTVGIRVSGTTAPLLSFTITFNVIKEFLDTRLSLGCSNENDIFIAHTYVHTYSSINGFCDSVN